MTIEKVPDLYPSEPLTVRLMNTIWADRDGVHDSMTTVGQLRQWAQQCGLRGTSGLTSADLEQARALRGALRRLAADVLDDHRPGAVDDEVGGDQALAVLNEVLAACVPAISRDGSGFRRDWDRSATGFRDELVTISLEAADLLASAGLGACHGPGCVLYFERAPARREWCSAGCGNRARVARHYRRRKNEVGGQGALGSS